MKLSTEQQSNVLRVHAHAIERATLADRMYYAGNSGMHPWGWWHSEHWGEGFMETRVQDSWRWGGDIWAIKEECL